MQVRSIILGAAGVIVALVFLKLAFVSQGSQQHAVDEGKLAKALGEYKRTEASARRDEPPPPTTVVRRKKPRTTESASETKSETSSDVARRSERTFVKPPPLETPDDDVDAKSQMDDANRLYDRADYEGARDAAVQLLEEDGENVRMLRIVVSSSCIMGDEEVATKHFSSLPPRDQRQMARRCKRYGIEFDNQDL